MRTVSVFLLLASLCCSAWSAPTKAVNDEVEHLFAYLGKSGCEFARNETWFSAKRGVEYLRSKYENLQKQGLIPTDQSFTAESFIDQVATHSNVSGHPYLIRCGHNPPTETGPWFRTELLRFREAKASGT
jgi:hypothetical protein